MSHSATTLPTSEPTRRRNWRALGLAALLLCVCLAAVACSDDQADPAIASQLIDQWIGGWSADDPDAVAAVFTDDGTYINPWDETVQGHDALGLYVTQHRMVVDEKCEDSVTATDEGTFTVSCQFTALGTDYVGEVEIELDGDLASRIEWLNVRP